MSEPICTCTELQRLTVCHDMRNEPHRVGCPRWGTPKKYATGGYVDADAGPLLEHPAPFVIIPPPRKPRYRLAASTNLYYHFVNVNTYGIQREHHTIRRGEFWGRKP